MNKLVWIGVAAVAAVLLFMVWNIETLPTPPDRFIQIDNTTANQIPQVDNSTTTRTPSPLLPQLSSSLPLTPLRTR
jgi:hypothetical protein